MSGVSCRGSIVGGGAIVGGSIVAHPDKQLFLTIFDVETK